MGQENKKFKLILTGVFAFFILLGLVAFSSFKATSDANNNVEISIWGTMDKIVFDSFISQYEQSKNLELKVKYTKKDISVIDGDLVEAIATGKAPDVILIPQELIKRYLDKVYFISSITERMFKDTYIGESEMYIQPGGIFAVPFFVDPLVMYWNRDTFASAGIANPPAKWSEFPIIASKISESDNNNANILKSAASLGEYRNVSNAKALLSTLIMQAGSPIVSMDDNGSLRSFLYSRSEGDILIPAVSALDFYTDYSNPKKSVYSWNRALPMSKQFFLSGDLAIYFGFASEANDLKEKNPNLNFDVAMMPQVVDAKTKVTYGELYGFAILKSSPNSVPAFNLISTITSADAIPELLKYMFAAPARRDLIAAGSKDAGQTVFNNSALIARGWIDPDSKKTDLVLQNMVEDVTTGRLTSNDSVQKASTEFDNLLQ
ncbi:MAG: ABC transporter substrate-binding protein [Candidatus Paceibacterota bacterium]|jgi:ABC-type glycerol-3-phosphate transport system substrate-binding protein